MSDSVLLNSRDDVTSTSLNATQVPPSDDVMDYFDVSDRAEVFVQSPQQVLALFLGLVGVIANFLCACAVLRVRHLWTNLHFFMFNLLTS